MRFFVFLLLSTAAYGQRASVDDLPTLTALMRDSAAVAHYLTPKGFVPSRSSAELVVFIEDTMPPVGVMANFVTLERRAGVVCNVSLVTGSKAIFQSWMNTLKARGFQYINASVVSGTRVDGFEREGMAVMAFQNPEGYYQLLAKQGVSAIDFLKQYFEL